MSDAVLLGIITAATGIIVAVISMVGAYLARQNRETRIAIDGRLSELLESARGLARAEGVVQGGEDERQAQRDTASG